MPLAQVRSMLTARQPVVPLAEVHSPPMPELTPEDDALSLVASATYFHDYEEDTNVSLASEPGSHSSAQGSIAETENGSMHVVMRMALDRLQLGVRNWRSQLLPVPSSGVGRPLLPWLFPTRGYLKDLQTWRDTRACTRLSAHGWTLAAVHDTARVGLERMSPIEPDIASLNVSPDEALRRETRGPRPQCRVTDGLLIQHVLAA